MPTVPADQQTNSSFIVDNDDGTTTIHLGWPEIPTGFRMNSLKTMHFREHTKRIAYWRDETFAHLAEGCPPLAWADVWVGEVVPYPPEHRWFPDVAASLPAVKAAIDGLILHAHLLADDTPQHLHSLTFASPVYVKGESWLTIELRGPRAR